MSLLSSLNPEQAQAVTLPNEHALILAGAGSGKTRVLTTRIAWLLETGQVSPGGILAVTFTNKAAKEMMARLSAQLPVNVRGMWIGTFHGLCNRFLRAHAQSVGLPQTFQILDSQDQLSAMKRLCKQYKIDAERFPPKELVWFVAGAKEDGLRPGDIEVRDPDTRKKVEIYELYEAQCQREGVVDFGELILRSYELLRDNAAVRAHYQRRFRHLLVDEFQDTNRLQYEWLKLLAGGDNAMLAVGDDDQSIYAFRGARVGNMADFVREFGVKHQIKLEHNYRSCSNILDTANTLISHNRQRLGKNLRTEAGEGELVRAMEAPSDYAEADWLMDEIKQLVRDGTPRPEMAILYRSNAQSRVIETGLFNNSIPYRVYGGLRFFERAEIKNALAYLRLIENPRDDTSFLRVVNFPPRGIGARSIEQLQDAAASHGCALSDAVDAVAGKAGTNLRAFVAKIDVMREQSVGKNLRDIIEMVIDQSGLVTHYETEREGQDRVENLGELVNAAESFVTQEGFGKEAVALPEDDVRINAELQALNAHLDTHFAAPETAFDDSLPFEALATERPSVGVPPPDAETGEVLSPLAAFLTHAALEAGDNQASTGQDAVQLMTVHASKGLEFDVVFITGLEEGLFPNERALADFDGLEEERRLMYVAITRARKRLYLTHAQTRMLHGQTRYNIRSRFFDELPENTLKWLSPPRSQFASPMSSGGFARGPRQPAPAWSPAWHGDAVTASPEPTSRGEAAAGIRTGVGVFHAKFGEGRVLAVEGQGNDARAQVNFPRHGTKWLALSVAKLTVVD
jgi:DNA helicase-2/ATP-dependent DNA helicase PcrA